MYRLDRMNKEYKQFTKAEGYILGFEQNGIVYMVKFNKIPRKFMRVQKEHGGKDYGLYVSIKGKKVQNELMKKAVAVGTLENLINEKYNKGVMFEKMICEYYKLSIKDKDNYPFYKGGDITLNGKEIQIKYLHARVCYNSTLKKLKAGL